MGGKVSSVKEPDIEMGVEATPLTVPPSYSQSSTARPGQSTTTRHTTSSSSTKRRTNTGNEVSLLARQHLLHQRTLSSTSSSRTTRPAATDGTVRPATTVSSTCAQPTLTNVPNFPLATATTVRPATTVSSTCAQPTSGNSSIRTELANYVCVARRVRAQADRPAPSAPGSLSTTVFQPKPVPTATNDDLSGEKSSRRRHCSHHKLAAAQTAAAPAAAVTRRTETTSAAALQHASTTASRLTPAPTAATPTTASATSATAAPAQSVARTIPDWIANWKKTGQQIAESATGTMNESRGKHPEAGVTRGTESRSGAALSSRAPQHSSITVSRPPTPVPSAAIPAARTIAGPAQSAAPRRASPDDYMLEVVDDVAPRPAAAVASRPPMQSSTEVLRPTHAPTPVTRSAAAPAPSAVAYPEGTANWEATGQRVARMMNESRTMYPEAWASAASASRPSAAPLQQASATVLHPTPAPAVAKPFAAVKPVSAPPARTATAPAPRRASPGPITVSRPNAAQLVASPAARTIAAPAPSPAQTRYSRDRLLWEAVNGLPPRPAAAPVSGALQQPPAAARTDMTTFWGAGNSGDVRRNYCCEFLADSFWNLSMNDRNPERRKYYGSSSYDDDSHPTVSYNEHETPVYILRATIWRIVVFEPESEKFIETERSGRRLPMNRTLSCLSEIEDGEIYLKSSNDIGYLDSAYNRDQYLFRDNFAYESADTYRTMILPALLLGSRVRDFEQRCATVDQIGTFVLSMPAQNRRLKELTLKTTTGTTFNVDVKFVKKGKEGDTDKKWIVTCHPPNKPLPTEVRKGSMLEIIGSSTTEPRVTAALMRTYWRRKAPIDNWTLLSAIYGKTTKRDYPDSKPFTVSIDTRNASFVRLNPEQAQAVAWYNCDVCPAFVVESPPGSGKTMTAAAMAVRYRGHGVQLFLSTANVPVINMALALAKLNIGTLRAIHLISSEREELMTEETRSPFSVLSLAKRDEDLKEMINDLEGQMKFAPSEEEKDRLRNAIRKVCRHIYEEKYNVFFGTVDMILGRLFKEASGGRQPDAIKQQLMNDVTRIVVDEASQLTESALNALILCFPKAQIVLIGDSKQLPPFKYIREDVVSELAARSALEVMKAKKNLPVINLNRVYRASPTLMAHYSKVFYDGALISDKAESRGNLLSCFGARSGGNKCLFWKVKGHQKQAGTSKINDGELSSLKYIINILRNSGISQKSVMIISYYEAQRKRAEEELPGYEVLTVDSAQGREKRIVIVMTTRTSVPTENGAFFSCPLRCNVAVSRHQEALIVLGHNAIASAPNWAKILSPKYFKHVEPFNVFDNRKNHRK